VALLLHARIAWLPSADARASGAARTTRDPAASHDGEVVASGPSDALRHVAVVRYDAFGDMGGRLSFSAAMLDDAGDGIVLTSINGRSETRTYAKGVADSRSRHSQHELSPEEERAVDEALGRERTRRR
jgi:hypothetical protein